MLKFREFFFIIKKIDGKYISDYQNNSNFHEKIINVDRMLINNMKKFACGGHPSGRLLQRRASLRRPAVPGLNCAGKTSRYRFVPSDVNKFEENIFFYHFFHFFFSFFFHFFRLFFFREVFF